MSIIRRSDILDSSDEVLVGQWYWVNSEDGRWLGCVIRLGSNFVALEGPGTWSVRILNDDFWKCCEREYDPDKVIHSEINKYRNQVAELTGQVRELTAQLSVAPSDMLPENGGETCALAKIGMGQDIHQYKADLIKAKNETLPDLFSKIKKATEGMAHWMEAKLIPLKAETSAMQSSIDHIKERIFHVQLYAGLTEDIALIQDGNPAPTETPIHLMQRRCYMDEECLLDYKAGGMEFKNIGEFDAWLTKPGNLNRILPFPRTVVSFRVRRIRKEHEINAISDIIRVGDLIQADCATFLYIRNGEQVFRMNTSIDFGPRLFPDLNDRQLKGDKLWAKMWSEGNVDRLITDREYQAIYESDHKELAEWEVLRKEDARNRAQWEADKAAGKNVPKRFEGNHRAWFAPHTSYQDYKPFNKSHVYYDDICEKVASDIKEHNRIVLILQGLLDRSPVFQPHPKWELWTASGFEAAFTLVLDDTRTLPAGEKPDFEAYRRKCNASLKDGSITVGQEYMWEKEEARKENDKMAGRGYRDRSIGYHRYRPYGNPGPGLVARVAKHTRSGKCTYAWMKEKSTREGTIRCTFTCSQKHVLNVEAYKPGDYHIFFDDPRTRQEYLQWAPLLLTAEDYHAELLKVKDVPDPQPKKQSSWEGKERYRYRKLHKELSGKVVQLVNDIEMKNGRVYKAGTVWRVREGGSGRDFSLSGIDTDGEHLARWINGAQVYDFKVVDDLQKALGEIPECQVEDPPEGEETEEKVYDDDEEDDIGLHLP